MQPLEMDERVYGFKYWLHFVLSKGQQYTPKNTYKFIHTNPFFHSFIHFFYNYLPCAGFQGGLEPIPAETRRDSESLVHHRAETQKQFTLALTPQGSLDSTIHPYFMFLDCGKKPEGTLATMRKTCKLHTEKPPAQSLRGNSATKCGES